jgi:hypothetical protein
MNLLTRFLLLAMSVAVLSGLPIYTGSALGAVAERDKLIEGAKKEGRLVLYTGMETEEAGHFTRAFTKK